MSPPVPENRGSRPAGQRCHRFEGYELDCPAWQLRFKGESVPLNRKTFDLLLYLIEARARVVGKDELMGALWPNQFVDENNLAQQISQLRKAFAKHSAEKQIIETVPGRGYKFVAKVTEEEPLPVPVHVPNPVLVAETSYARIVLEEEFEASDAVSGQPLAKEHALPAPRTRRLLIVVLTAVTILLVAGAFWGWLWWQNRPGGPPVAVVLTPVEGSTGDAALDGVLGDAFRFDLSQSPVVSIASRAQVSETLGMMVRKPEEKLTAPVAREVCERLNAQAVVQSRVARNGQHFLLSAEAIGCVDGATLASATEEVTRSEDLRVFINRMAGQMRRKLGESRTSIARFNTPSATLQTASLEALRAASAANAAFAHGKWAEALNLEKQAIALDPQFAAAYYNLSSAYVNLGDIENARAAAQKAYDLRGSVSPLMQFTIDSRYQQLVTGDLYETEKTSEVWTDLYPRSDLAWNQLGVTRENLGDWRGAAQAAAREVELRPNTALEQDRLAQNLMYSGDFQGARLHADRAAAIDPNFASSHIDRARLALATDDDALAKQEIDWLNAHPDNPLMQAIQAELSIARGQFVDAKEWLRKTDETYRKQGELSSAADVSKVITPELIGAGDYDGGLALYRSHPVNWEEPSDLVAAAVVGDGAKAEAALKAQLGRHPRDTKLLHWYAPLIEGWAALKQGRTQDAVKILNQPGTLSIYGDIDFARGMAFLANKQPKEAAAAFRTLTDHPYRDYTFQVTVGWLELARALTASGDRPAAAEAYAKFLHIWRNADTGSVLYKQAKLESAVLNIASR